MQKYFEPSLYMRRSWRLVNCALSAVSDVSPRDRSPRRPVTFILGAPRSGSTLLMQVLTDAFRFGYLSNQHCEWFGAPVLAERVFRPLAAKRPSEFVSRHGRTKGIDAPAECGAWWYRFFRRQPAYVTLKDVSERKMLAFRRSVADLEAAVGLPLIFKNLYASLRIEPIAHYLPKSLFVVIERDEVDNAQSILKGRKDALGSYEPWWSVPPPNIEEIKVRPPVEQAIEQVRAIHSLIDSDIQRLHLQDRTFRIRYEDFCADVHGVLDQFAAFMKSHGVELGKRFEVPGHFDVMRGRKIPTTMYEQLVEYAHRTHVQRKSYEAGDKQ